jgi:hypothetical protein
MIEVLFVSDRSGRGSSTGRGGAGTDQNQQCLRPQAARLTPPAGVSSRAGKAGSSQGSEGKLAAGTRSPPSGETDGSTGGAESEVVTVVVGAGVALAAPFAPGAFAPVSRPGLAGGGAGGVGVASPAGAPAAGRDGEDGTGAGEGDPAGPVSGAALSGPPA